MKRYKVLLLALVALLVLSQLPFAYRRYKLRRLSSNIRSVNASRHSGETDTTFSEYVGVSHVHSFLGGHSTGTFSDIISAAQLNKLSFVIMTEHTEKDYDTAEMTLKGVHGGVLFINGNEVSSSNGDRLLLLPGSSPVFRVVAYPDTYKSWDKEGVDGVEVYNVFTNAKRVNPIFAFFDSLWSRRTYGDLLFATFYSRPNESLERWDEALRNRRLVATAGNDAHANIGVSLNDSSGKTLFGMKLDPYETSFRLVRLHVLAPSRDSHNLATTNGLDAAHLLDAIKEGHCFIGFDLFGDTYGFRFSAQNGAEKGVQGDELKLTGQTSLAVDVPVTARVLILKDGKPHYESPGSTHVDLPVTDPGVYRVEVYLPQLGNLVSDKPWIISNPIYIR